MHGREDLWCQQLFKSAYLVDIAQLFFGNCKKSAKMYTTGVPNGGRPGIAATVRHRGKRGCMEIRRNPTAEGALSLLEIRTGAPEMADTITMD
jgi:hypothetical protein